MDAFIFPGQGSQTIGMGREVYEAFPVAREVFQEVDEALKQNLTALIFEGDLETLSLTENTQPALMATSIALLRVLESEANLDLSQHVNCVAGHSLGEYSALVAAKALSLRDAAKLLRLRGQVMQEAVPVGQGAMAALLGVDCDQAEAIAREASEGLYEATGSADSRPKARGEAVCDIANDNAPGQVVLSGHKEAVNRACSLAPIKGARKAVLLPVSAPFHCSLMKPAAEKMARALEDISLEKLALPLIANVKATEISNEDIKGCLVEQVAGRVRWRESILDIEARGVKRTVEIGAGKVLTGLTKRITKGLTSVALNMPQDIEAYLKERF